MPPTNVLFRLPKIFSLDVLGDWISTVDLSALDCAMTNKCLRSIFLEYLAHDYFSTHGIDASYMKYKYLCWVFFRRAKVKVLKLGGLMNADVDLLADMVDSYSRLESLHVSHCLDINTIKLSDVLWKTGRRHKNLKSLGFVRCHVVSEQSVVQLIGTSPELTAFDMSHTNSLTTTSLLMLTASCKNIRELRLSHCHHLGTANGAQVLVQVAETFGKTLQRLDISSNSFVSSAIVCCIVVKCPGLLELNISDSVEIDDSTLLTIAACCTQLQILGLNNSLDITNVGLSAVAKACCDLESLDVSHCSHISDASVTDIAQHCLSLTSLRVAECNRISDTVLIQIAENCYDLTELDLTYCHCVSDASIMGISKCCPTLASLSVAYCYKLSDVSVITLASSCAHLRSMDLTCCDKLTDTGMLYLVEECGSTLTSLHIAGCTQLTDVTIMAIAACCSASLRFLDCSDNGHYTDVAIVKLVTCCCTMISPDKSFTLRSRSSSMDADVMDIISSTLFHSGGRLTTLVMAYCAAVTRATTNYIALHFPKLDLQSNWVRRRDSGEEVEGGGAVDRDWNWANM